MKNILNDIKITKIGQKFAEGSIFETPWSCRSFWTPFWILKNAHIWTKFTFQILFANELLLQVKPGFY